MNIDFKPGVRFLKNTVEKGEDTAKNIAAFAKHYPGQTIMCGAVVIALAPFSLGGAAIMGGFMLYGVNGAGRFDRLRDENEMLAANKDQTLSL